MKILRLSSLILILILSSCTSEENHPVYQESDTDAINPESGFEVSVEKDMLSFPTRADYDAAIAELGTMDSDQFELWEAKIGFASMRSITSTEHRASIGIEDDLLATLLNQDAIIKIGDYIYRVDIPNEEVHVLGASAYANKNSFSAGKQQSLSIHENVLDVVAGLEQPMSQSERSRYCSKRKLSWNTAANLLSAKIVYQKAGILNSLQSKIQQDKVNIFNLGLKTNGTNNFWRNKKKSGTIGPYETTFFVAETKSYRPYYSSRRLRAYHFSVEFRAQDKNFAGTSNGMITKVLTIDCN
ncbi:MAG: hypothetical protein AAGD88_02575 [Bacteroidota bacterium]